MNKRLYLLLAVCASTAIGADLPSSGRPISSYNDSGFRSAVDASKQAEIKTIRQATRFLKKIRPDLTCPELKIDEANTVLDLKKSCKTALRVMSIAPDDLKRSFVTINKDSPDVLFPRQVKELLDAEIDTRLSGNKKIVRFDAHNGKAHYAARGVNDSNAAILISQFLQNQPNLIAFKCDDTPQTTKGTEALPTTNTAYNFYEIPVCLRILASDYPAVIGGYLFPILEKMGIKPLTFGNANMMFEKTVDDEAPFRGLSLDESQMGLLSPSVIAGYKEVVSPVVRGNEDTPIVFRARFHTSEENVESNKEFLANYFQANFAAMQDLLAVGKKDASKGSERSSKTKRAKVNSEANQASSSSSKK